MSNLTEQDYDSATPALEQQMNLARRACWRSSKDLPATASPGSGDPASRFTILNPAMLGPNQSAKPPSDESKTNIEPETKARVTKATCNASPSGIFGKRALLLLALCLLLGLSQGRPNMSATPSKDSGLDAVTQLNVSTS